MTIERVGWAVLAGLAALVGTAVVFAWGMICAAGMMHLEYLVSLRTRTRYVDVEEPGSPPDFRMPLIAVFGLLGLFLGGFPNILAAFGLPALAALVIGVATTLLRLYGYPGSRRRQFVGGEDGVCRSTDAKVIEGRVIKRPWFDIGAGYLLVASDGREYLNRYPNADNGRDEIEIILQRSKVPMLDLRFGRAMPEGDSHAAHSVPEGWGDLLVSGDRRIPVGVVDWWRALMRPSLGRHEMRAIPVEEFASNVEGLMPFLPEDEQKRAADLLGLAGLGGGPVMAATWHTWQEYRPEGVPKGAWRLDSLEQGVWIERWQWKRRDG